MTTDTLPAAWRVLLEALTLLAQHPSDDTSPFNCSHDQLTVMADDTAFTDAELDRLAYLGFDVSRDGGFRSYRFGSA